MSNDSQDLSNKDLCFFRRFLGRMETGKDTVSDPAMAEGKRGLWGPAEEVHQHPTLPERLRKIDRLEGKFSVTDKDAVFYSYQTVSP